MTVYAQGDGAIHIFNGSFVEPYRRVHRPPARGYPLQNMTPEAVLSYALERDDGTKEGKMACDNLLARWDDLHPSSIH